MTWPVFPPGSPEHRWVAEQIDQIITGWETTRDAADWVPHAEDEPVDQAECDECQAVLDELGRCWYCDTALVWPATRELGL